MKGSQSRKKIKKQNTVKRLHCGFWLNQSHEGQPEMQAEVLAFCPHSLYVSLVTYLPRNDLLYI